MGPFRRNKERDGSVETQTDKTQDKPLSFEVLSLAFFAGVSEPHMWTKADSVEK